MTSLDHSRVSDHKHPEEATSTVSSGFCSGNGAQSSQEVDGAFSYVEAGSKGTVPQGDSRQTAASGSYAASHSPSSHIFTEFIKLLGAVHIFLLLAGGPVSRPRLCSERHVVVLQRADHVTLVLQ